VPGLTPIRTAIVDDEPLARERLRVFLKEEPGIELVAECRDGREAVETLSELRPDLVFLDVQMPEIDGFDVLSALGDGRPRAVVFVTAFDAYAVRAFDAHALDYLLKPYDRERFRATLRRVRERLGGAEPELETRLAALLRQVGDRGSRFVERLTVRTGNRIRLVDVADIDYFEAEGNYIRLHAGERNYLVRETMTGLEASLDPARFARIHRSTIVNLSRVQELEPLFQGEYLLILKNGRRITSSRGYRSRVHEALGLG
jgi:two-component system, LytTR family, response regulator